MVADGASAVGWDWRVGTRIDGHGGTLARRGCRRYGMFPRAYARAPPRDPEGRVPRLRAYVRVYAPRRRMPKRASGWYAYTRA